MGLDMYLSAKRYMWREEREAVKVTGIDIPQPLELKELSCSAAYWRKANAIHQWFVDNVQDGEDDCQEYEVGRDELTALLILCQTVKEKQHAAVKLLPPSDGFFFGSQDIDEGYWQDIDYTIERLTQLLDTRLDGWGFVYQSSW